MKFTRMVIVLSWEFPNQTRRNNAFGSTIFMKKKHSDRSQRIKLKLTAPGLVFATVVAVTLMVVVR